MSDAARQINTILKIRKMRVDHMQRQHRQLQNHIDTQSQAMGKAQMQMEEMHRDNVNKERETLTHMIGVDSLKLSSIVDYVKLQQHGVKRLGDAKRDTDLIQQDIEESKDNLAVSGAKLVQAEKKLLGIEEVIKEKLWIQK